MKTYFANFSANNGTCFRTPIKGTNKKELIQRIRSIAEAERFAGNECSWAVWLDDENDEDECNVIAKGGMLANGMRYRIV